MARSNGAHLDLSPEYLRGAGAREISLSQAIDSAECLGGKSILPRVSQKGLRCGGGREDGGEGGGEGSPCGA